MIVLRNVFTQEAVSSFLSAKKTKKALNIPINTSPRSIRNGHSRVINVLYGVRMPFSEKSLCTNVSHEIKTGFSVAIFSGFSVVGITSSHGIGAPFSIRHSKNT
ncbi:MAG: hypothetical protein WCK88_06125 [bacterium]